MPFSILFSVAVLFALLIGCATPQKRTDAGGGDLGRRQELRNVRDESGNVIEQFLYGDKATYHAKPENLTIPYILFVTRMETGELKILRAVETEFKGRVWFTRDITIPSNPVYIAAAFEEGSSRALKRGPKQVASFKSVGVNKQGIVQFRALPAWGIEMEIKDLEPQELANLRLSTVSRPTDYRPCTIRQMGEKYYMDRCPDVVEFLLLGNTLVAFADMR